MAKLYLEYTEVDKKHLFLEYILSGQKTISPYLSVWCFITN